MRRVLTSILVIAAMGCSTDDRGVGGFGDVPASGDENTDKTSTGACGEQGLALEGLMYSPGGTLLPHPCEPYHATRNNPYAVRCIDAWSWYQTPYPGDEYCVLPPEPGKGIQIGVHPQGSAWYEQVSTGDLSGYDDVPGAFLLAGGDEEEKNYLTSTGNTEQRNYYRSNARMRAGSHHMIVSAHALDEAEQRETWGPGSATAGLRGNSLPGAQRPDQNVPYTLSKPAEDQGLYRPLAPDQTVVFNMHHFNASDGQILKEAWINIWWEETDATIPVIPIFGMPLSEARATFAQPGETVDMHYSWSIEKETRVVELFGHRHAWTPSFSAWVVKENGEQEILYQSFDWFDQPVFRYDSISDVPDADAERRVDGGSGGLRMLQPGEELHFNCHMAFTPERAAETGAPMPSSIGPLRFANQAFTGEMCILFGSTAGTSLGQPAVDERPVPDFAKIE